MEKIADNFIHFILMILVFYFTSNGYLNALDVVRFITMYFGVAFVTSIVRYYLRKD